MGFYDFLITVFMVRKIKKFYSIIRQKITKVKDVSICFWTQKSR